MAQQVRTAPEVATGPVTLGDPGPLGLSAFALTTFVLSVINAGLLGTSLIKINTATAVVVGLAVFYGGLGQLLAGMWEFRNNNTFGATAFTSYGGFWLSFAALLIPGFGIKLATILGAPLGVYLLGWAIFTGFMAVAALRLNGALLSVFVALTLTFLALAIGQFVGPNGANPSIWWLIGGWLGILTALLAWYTAFAGVLRSTKGPFQLPIFPMR
jgi:succinate-acetate transporter protein